MPAETLKSCQITIQKICMYVYLLLYQSLSDLTNPIGRNLISVPVLTNGLGRNLISILGLTNALCHRMRLISALVLTSHLKCHIILLILLCLAVPFLQPQALFCNQSTTAEIFVEMLIRMNLKHRVTGCIHRSHTINKL